MTALPAFVRLYPGPTLMWGPETKTPGGMSFAHRFCTLNLWALDESGRVWVLAYDYARGGDDELPIWMRWPNAQSA